MFGNNWKEIQKLYFMEWDNSNKKNVSHTTAEKLHFHVIHCSSAWYSHTSSCSDCIHYKMSTTSSYSINLFSKTNYTHYIRFFKCDISLMGQGTGEGARPVTFARFSWSCPIENFRRDVVDHLRLTGGIWPAASAVVSALEGTKTLLFYSYSWERSTELVR